MFKTHSSPIPHNITQPFPTFPHIRKWCYYLSQLEATRRFSHLLLSLVQPIDWSCTLCAGLSCICSLFCVPSQSRAAMPVRWTMLTSPGYLPLVSVPVSSPPQPRDHHPLQQTYSQSLFSSCRAAASMNQIKHCL